MKPRESVLRFAQMMEERLAANDHKGGWANETPDWLAARIVEECGELLGALAQNQAVGEECADIANLAMMVADVCGELEALVNPPMPR